MAGTYREEQARQELIAVCRSTYARGYISGNEGNFSIRLGGNTILTTPRGTCKAHIDETDLVLVDLRGNPVSAGQPSTEIKMHIAAYEKRHDIAAVVHAHPTCALACSLAEVDLTQYVLPEVVCTLGTIPTAPYATPSTDEVPDSISDLVTKYDAMILDHHGVLCLGVDIWDAFYKLETVEHYAQVMALARLLGGAKSLGAAQVEKLLNLRSLYGVKSIASGP